MTVQGTRCDALVHVIARDVTLSDTLKTMADTYGFTLRFASSRDPVMDFERIGTPETVLRELTASSNLLAIHRPDATCGHPVITEVQILAVGENLAPFVYTPKPAEPQAAGTLQEVTPEQAADPRTAPGYVGPARGIPRDVWQKHNRELRKGRAVYDPRTGKVEPVEGAETKGNGGKDE